MDEIRVSVKHAAQTLDVALPAGATVGDLQARLEALTGVLVRRQKLMAKGRVISGAAGSLAGVGVGNGAKLMLLAAAGAVPSQVRGCVGLASKWSGAPAAASQPACSCTRQLLARPPQQLGP